MIAIVDDAGRRAGIPSSIVSARRIVRLALCVLLLGGACDGIDVAPSGPMAGFVGLPSHDFKTAGGVLFEGTLRSDGKCFWLSSGTATLSLIWPLGYRGMVGSRSAVLLDGEVIAEANDVLALDATLRDDLRPSFCAVGSSSLIVGSIDSVNGRDIPVTQAPVAPTPPRTIR